MRSIGHLFAESRRGEKSLVPHLASGGSLSFCGERKGGKNAAKTNDSGSLLVKRENCDCGKEGRVRETQEGCPSLFKSIVFETFSEFQKLKQRNEIIFSFRCWIPCVGAVPSRAKLSYPTNQITHTRAVLSHRLCVYLRSKALTRWHWPAGVKTRIRSLPFVGGDAYIAPPGSAPHSLQPVIASQ